jgi:FkbM family methyltransferase
MLLDLIYLSEKHKMDIKGVIHIGAHFGEENSTYDELKIKNRIFFEPLKTNFKVLQENIGEKYILVNKALGNENKNTQMFVETANGGQSSSILEPELHLHQYPHIKFESTEEVEMVRLDDFLTNKNDYNFINIDVQGFELEVFKGSEKTLSNVDYIMTEINRAEVYKNCAKIEELVDFLKPFGFVLIEETWDGVTWGDGLFIKEKKN